jgi:hypothetical protein
MFNFLRRKKKPPSNEAFNVLVDKAMKSHGDEVMDELELKAIFYAAKINNQYIHSDEVALQFILEELDAARQGNDVAVNFVNNSGFEKNDYIGAMKNSIEEVDGPEGPQQLLLGLIMTVDDMDERVKFRISIVDKIMQERKLGKYSDK